MTGAELVFVRNRAWTDSLRAYRIEVDGEAVGSLRSSGELRVPVSAGSHDVRARLGHMSTQLFVNNVADGEHRTYDVRPARGSPFAKLAKLTPPIEITRRHHY